MADLKLQLFEEPRDVTGILKSWAFRLIVAGLFISVGKGKFAEHGQWVAIFAQIGFGQWFRYFTGVLQIAGGVLVLIPRTFPVGIIILACTMLGAMGAWLFFLGSPLTAIIPGALLLGLLAIGGEPLLDFAAVIRRKTIGTSGGPDKTLTLPR